MRRVGRRKVLCPTFCRPEPPYAAGPPAAAVGATAMIDVSDGLIADAGHIARASGISIDVRTEGLEIPGPLRAVGSATGTDRLRFVLTGAEEHSLLLPTFPAGRNRQTAVVAGHPKGTRMTGTRKWDA